jgi:hypothetical protein
MNYKVTLWQVCGRVFRDDRIETCYAVTDHSITCDDFMHFFRSIQAFYILTAVFSLISIVFAVLDHGQVQKFMDYRTILLFLAFLMVFVCSIIGWALAIASVHHRSVAPRKTQRVGRPSPTSPTSTGARRRSS